MLFLDLVLFAVGASQLVELGAEIVFTHAPFCGDPPLTLDSIDRLFLRLSIRTSA
jgi:hypothetical protein